jgi:hypothetical protein
MSFNPNNSNKVPYGGVYIYFDKEMAFHDYFNHKQQTRKFPYYRNIIEFLSNDNDTKLYFTLSTEVINFTKVSEGFLINMRAYQDFCKTIGSKTGGRLKAFLGQNVSLREVSATTTERDSFIKANATAKNIIGAIEGLDEGSRATVMNSFNGLHSDDRSWEIESKEFIDLLPKFLSNENVRDALLSNLPRVHIDTLKSHISFLKENLGKSETFITKWLDENDGKLRKQRCLIFGLEYVDPKREGQIAGKKFDILAEQDLEHYVIFELKAPKDDIFKIVINNTKAGGDSTEYHLSRQLSRAIPEVLGYKKMYEAAQNEEIQKFGLKIKKPISKCVIVIGTRNDDPVWKENFDRISNCLNGIELLTYNHLIDRLENIVKNLEENTSTT